MTHGTFRSAVEGFERRPVTVASAAMPRQDNHPSTWTAWGRTDEALGTSGGDVGKSESSEDFTAVARVQSPMSIHIDAVG
jgi:hypothetical protein